MVQKDEGLLRDRSSSLAPVWFLASLRSLVSLEYFGPFILGEWVGEEESCHSIEVMEA